MLTVLESDDLWYQEHSIHLKFVMWVRFGSSTEETDTSTTSYLLYVSPHPTVLPYYFFLVANLTFEGMNELPEEVPAASKIA